MSPPLEMPVLPGLTYDAATNRYYKTRVGEPPPPSAPPAAPAPPRRRRTLQSLLTASQTGGSSVPALQAALLCRAARRPAPSTYFSAADVPVVQGAGCMALVSPNGNVDLRHFPSGGCLDSLYVPEHILGMAWSDAACVVGLVLRGPTPTFDKVQMARFPMEGTRRDWLCKVLLAGQAHSIALSPALDPVVGADKFTEVFRRRELSDGAERRARLVHKDRSAGLVTLFTGENEVTTGTRAGSVFRWDLRMRSGRPVYAIRPSKEGCSVTDMKPSVLENRLYVSCMRNEQFNLAAWDMRMIRDKSPMIVYKEHTNSYKPLRFDVDESTSGGLLAAGGDDGFVRIWSANEGGEPLERIGFANEMPKSVMLVGWAQSPLGPRPRPGAWVVTDKQPYVLEVGSRHANG